MGRALALVKDGIRVDNLSITCETFCLISETSEVSSDDLFLLTANGISLIELCSVGMSD